MKKVSTLGQLKVKREFYNPQLECDDFETFEFTIYDWRASLYGQQSLETMPVDWHIGGFEPYPTLNSAKRILVKEIKPEYNFNKLPKNISWCNHKEAIW